MTACRCDPWAASEECPIHGDTEHRAPSPCPDCRNFPEDGDRHGLCDGLTEDGDVLGVTCLDASGDILFPPDPAPSLPVESRYPDPWSTQGPVPLPPF